MSVCKSNIRICYQCFLSDNMQIKFIGGELYYKDDIDDTYSGWHLSHLNTWHTEDSPYYWWDKYVVDRT